MHRALIVVFGLVVSVSAVLGLGAVPLPASYPQTRSGADASSPTGRHQIFVLSNGFHAAIAVPAGVFLMMPDGAAPVEDVLGIDPADFPVKPTDVRYWLVGWGSETAYTSLREVRDLTMGIAARALAFDATVMHVQPLGSVTADRPGAFGFTLSEAQLSALVTSMSHSFASAEPMPDVTQGFGDRFYPGRGRFSVVNSCNSWVGRKLRRAGIGIGLWTPLAQTLEFSLQRAEAAQAR